MTFAPDYSDLYPLARHNLRAASRAGVGGVEYFIDVDKLASEVFDAVMLKARPEIDKLTNETIARLYTEIAPMVDQAMARVFQYIPQATDQAITQILDQRQKIVDEVWETAKPKIDEYINGALEGGTVADQIADIKKQAIVGAVIGGIGAAVAAAGLTYWLLEYKPLRKIGLR